MTTAILEDNPSLVTDLARFSEGLADEKFLRKHYRLAERDWEELANDDVVELVELEKLRRIRSGDLKRERAQKHVVKAPDVLADIMTDPKANPRHVIDAVKTLDVLAANGPQAIPATERFIITINLGGDTLNFSKPRAVGLDDAGNQIDASTPAAITANPKMDDGGGGEPRAR
jgi:hypothetical protein